MFFLILGVATQKAEAKTLKQIKVEMMSLTTRIKNLSQQASVLMARPTPGMPAPVLPSVIPGVETGINTEVIIPQSVIAPEENLFNQTLRKGSTGPEVVALQQILIAKGYFVGVPDGVFGGNTVKAVQDFQRVNGEKADGVVGPGTMLKMESSAGIIENTENTEKTKENIQVNNIEQTTKKNNSNIFATNSCKETAKSQMFVGLGEVYDKTKDSLYRASDIWSTEDGVNWSQIAKTTAMKEKWEPIMVTVGKTVYEFGGKYQPNSSSDDVSVYKTTDMINWSYVGDMPDLSRYYDKSVVYFNNKFWLMGVDSNNKNHEDIAGVWSSSDGANWKQEVTKAIWDGMGRDRVSNSKGSYDSSSLGGFVLGGKKMFYLVLNEQSTSSNPQISIYSTSDGKKWKSEGLLKNNKDGTDFKIGLNTNPSPIVHSDGKVYIMSTVRASNTPIVISSSDGVKWDLVSTSQTDYPLGYYSTDLSFNGKLWKIGGWNYATGNDNNIYSSSDGVKWTKMEQKGVTFAGPAGRHLAFGTVLTTANGTNPSDLKVTDFVEQSYYSLDDINHAVVGIWKLSATSEKNSGAKGDITISSLNFLGTDFKTSKGTTSSLEFLKNIKVKISTKGGFTNQVGSVSAFSGPFYDTTDTYALTQTLTLDKPLVIKNGEEVTLSVYADTSFSSGVKEFTNYLAGFGFKGLGNPCAVYSGKNSKETKSPGIISIRK